MHVTAIRGIYGSVIDKLAEAGIKTSEALLEKGRTPTERQELAARIGIDPKMLITYLNRADLARITGIGEVYSNLLGGAGIATAGELASYAPGSLRVRLVEYVRSGEARRAPTLAQVQGWIAQAKRLDRAIEY